MSKYQLINQLLHDTAVDVSSSGDRWVNFLSSSAWMYKYTIEEQLLIFAQKPNAKACAEFNVWNEKMHRWIKKNSKGIALLTDNDSLRYVFDVADTVSIMNEPFRLWNFNKSVSSDYQSIIEKLENYYGEFNRETFSETIESIAKNLVEDNSQDYLSSLVKYNQGSKLEEMNVDEIKVIFNELVQTSVIYEVCERIEVRDTIFYMDSIFEHIHYFDTMETFFQLGQAVSDISENLISQIVLSSKQVSRENSARTFAKSIEINQNESVVERSEPNEQDRVSSSSRLSVSESESREANNIREIRTNEERVPEKISTGTLSSTKINQPIEQASIGDTRRSKSDARDNHESEIEDNESRNSRFRDTSVSMGSNNESDESRSRRSGYTGDNLQLDFGEEFGGVEEVKETIPPFNMQDLPTILRDKGMFVKTTKEEIIQFFYENPSTNDRRNYIREHIFEGTFQTYRKRSEYDYEYIGYFKSGFEPKTDDVKIFSGTFLTSKSETTVDTEYIANAIAKLIENDEFMQSPYEKMTLLQKHIHNGNVNRDVDRILFSHLNIYTLPSAEIIETLQRLNTNKEKEEFIRTIFESGITSFEIDDISVGFEKREEGLYFFVEDYASPKLDYNYKWRMIVDEIEGLVLSRYFDPTIQLPSEKEQRNAVYSSIKEYEKGNYFSQEEVDKVLAKGSGVSKGKFRIYDVLSNDGDVKGDIAFLKNEYGIGGSAPAVGHISEDHNAKGIRLRKGYIGEDGIEVLLSWSKVRKRIKELIANDRYLSKKEKEEYPFYLVNEFKPKEFDEKSKNTLPTEKEQPKDYKYIEGDIVHIGIDEYEVIEVNDSSIELRDLSFPLFSKEYSKEELDKVVAENPLNEKLLRLVDIIEATIEEKNGSKEIVVGEKVFTSWQLFYRKNVNGLLDNIQGHWSYDGIRESESAEEAIDLLDETVGNFIVNGMSDPFFNYLYMEDEEFRGTVLDELFDKTYNDIADKNGNINEIDSYESLYEEHLRKVVLENLRDEESTSINIPKENYKIEDNDIQVGAPKERYQNNIVAIKLLFLLEKENRNATEQEQGILAKYVGWGGLADAFDETKSNWANEYAEVKSLLRDDEYNSARESTLTAFYTSPMIIKSMYQALENMGFKYGNILEPSCATGNFIGMLPESLKDSKLYGIELDSISGRIAKKLYPKSNIEVDGYENVNLPDSFFDVAIGNIPFGQFKVPDKRYDKLNFSIHDYFFAKTIDKVRPKGIIAFITSRYTMDKANSTVRRYINERAELIGAIRLPNDAFKSAAGTNVVSDIIFLQKRERPMVVESEWIHTEQEENGNAINSYFINNPDMVLGNLSSRIGMYGKETLDVEPFDNVSLDELISGAIMNIHTQIDEYTMDDNLDNHEDTDTIPADPKVRNFSYTIYDGNIYYRENSIMRKINTTVTAKNRITGLVEIRDSVRNLIYLQTEDYSESEIKDEQRKLNNIYDSYTNKYGLINSRGNRIAFRDDNSYFLLASLEILNEDGTLKRKADMFTKRTIRNRDVVTKVETAMEALPISLAEKGKVDIHYIATLCFKSESEVIDDLHGVIYQEPHLEGMLNTDDVTYVTSDEYLSGNIREKLIIAKSAAILDKKFDVHVKALEQALPEPISASEIAVRIGTTWVDTVDYRDFIFELLDTSDYGQSCIDVTYSDVADRWNIKNKSSDRGNIKAERTYGTKRVNAYKLIEDCLNLKSTKIYDTEYDDEGNRIRVLNKKETIIAQQKQDTIKESFKEWVWEDGSRRERLSKKYNQIFNSIRPRQYDGEHLTFPNMNPEITLRNHQKNAVARIMYGNNALLAHVVGSGKTYTMAAAAMELKRLGISNKQMFIVPNHLVGQWGVEFLQLYPSANILVATKKDFEMNNRKRFCSRIATGEYDAIIMGFSTFEKVRMSAERQCEVIENEITSITRGIEELKANNGERFTVKQLEKTKKSLKNRLAKLNDDTRKDDVICFEELGIDRIFVDEAHNYKNLFLYTKMTNVAGISQTEAQKSSDLYMKCRYLDEITNNRGTVFATGTPVSNSMTEMYTMQRYLQYNTLQKMRLENFDSWASTFGETVNAVELTPEGRGYRMKTRFAKFYNLPELLSVFKEVADIQTEDMLDLPTPKAHYHNISVIPSDEQRTILDSLANRAEEIRGGSVDPAEDNMLKITNDGRKLALDQRLIDNTLPEYANSKVNACIQNAFEIYEETKENKSTQLIFCDMSTPKPNVFNIYDEIKERLIDIGIPENEIEFIHNANTDIQKSDLFAKVRNGSIRILLGSTSKMGAGTNVQTRLYATHDLDCPWRPSDLAQRAGRIVRQGNSNENVYIYRYVTEETFDAYLYQLVENKQKFISQIMTSKSPVRTAEDIDDATLSYAEIKALASGNPLIKEKMDLDIQVGKLQLEKASYLSQKYELEDSILKLYPQKIAVYSEIVKNGTADLSKVRDTEEFSGMTIFKIKYFDKDKAGAALKLALSDIQNEEVYIGEYHGFKISVIHMERQYCHRLYLNGNWRYEVDLGSSEHGNITRIDNVIKALPEIIEKAKSNLEHFTKQLETAKEEVKKPFSKEEVLKEKSQRLSELNKELDIGKGESEIEDSVIKEEHEKITKEYVR